MQKISIHLVFTRGHLAHKSYITPHFNHATSSSLFNLSNMHQNFREITFKWHALATPQTTTTAILKTNETCQTNYNN